MSQEELAWELAEDFAIEKFYIKGSHIKTSDNIAEKPAFLLFQRFFHSKWTLALVRLQLWHFSSKQKAYNKVQEIASKANVPIEIILKTRSGYKVIAKKD